MPGADVRKGARKSFDGLRFGRVWVVEWRGSEARAGFWVTSAAADVAVVLAL